MLLLMNTNHGPCVINEKLMYKDNQTVYMRTCTTCTQRVKLPCTYTTHTIQVHFDKKYIVYTLVCMDTPDNSSCQMMVVCLHHV